MKAASIHDIGKELKEISEQQLRDLCLRLAKYKKENKELLTYLLFEAHDEHAYVQQMKQDMQTEFEEIPNLNVYYLKKSLRRILRTVNKQIRYSGQATTELELRIHFCQLVRKHKVPTDQSTVLGNLYRQQLKKIETVVHKLDEDLQFDYHAAISEL